MINKISHNDISEEHHIKIIEMGYWQDPPHIATLLMLIATEIVKLFDEDRLNKPEKLADITLRLYDLCGYYKINLNELPTADKYSLWHMMKCLTNELEAYRVGMNTEYKYIRECISMCYAYAWQNKIDLIYEIQRKREIINYMTKKRI